MQECEFCFSGDTRQGYKPFTVMQQYAPSGGLFLHLGVTIYADRNGAARSLEEVLEQIPHQSRRHRGANCFSETASM
jgi:hypothetical protein